MKLKIKGYVIICDMSINMLSHDWGTEFYYKKEEADARAKELFEVCGSFAKFTVIPVALESLESFTHPMEVYYNEENDLETSSKKSSKGRG
jgi:hypothetical protein